MLPAYAQASVWREPRAPSFLLRHRSGVKGERMALPDEQFKRGRRIVHTRTAGVKRIPGLWQHARDTMRHVSSIHALCCEGHRAPNFGHQCVKQ
jgi:hypothetical protein